MNLPEEIRRELRARVWKEAEALGWAHLPPAVKSQQYDNWAKDPHVGGVIERYFDRHQVRAYLKDTLLKRYSATMKGNPERPLRLLGVSASVEFAEEYVKPHGRRLSDGRVIAWGKSSEWKAVVIALHERVYGHREFRPYGAVFFEAIGRFGERNTREMVEDAASKLGVARVVWVEM